MSTYAEWRHATDEQERDWLWQDMENEERADAWHEQQLIEREREDEQVGQCERDCNGAGEGTSDAEGGDQGQHQPPF